MIHNKHPGPYMKQLQGLLDTLEQLFCELQDGFTVHLANEIRGYVERGEGGAPERPRGKTCEIRWNGSSWTISSLHLVEYRDTLDDARERARNRGCRVTNDPREVVLRELPDGWHAAYKEGDGWFYDAAQFPLSLEDWRERMATRGWRILREETASALACSFCLKTNKQVKVLIRGEGVAICDECFTVCQRLMAERANREKPAEQRPTLGELLSQTNCYPALGKLLDRIVEAIGRDRR
jgi:hypothetical protein